MARWVRPVRSVPASPALPLNGGPHAGALEVNRHKQGGVPAENALAGRRAASKRPSNARVVREDVAGTGDAGRTEGEATM